MGLASAGIILAVLQPGQPAIAASEARICPNPQKLQGFCSLVYERAEAPEGSGYRYLYQQSMHEAACANNPSLYAEDNIQKIQSLWKQHPERFRCNSTDFDVPGGSVLKYSIAARSFHLLVEATRWKIDLNQVDAADERTLLDYLYKEVEANRGSEIEPQLAQYMRILRRNGAKFRCELPPDQRFRTPAIKPVLDGVAVCA